MRRFILYTCTVFLIFSFLHAPIALARKLNDVELFNKCFIYNKITDDTNSSEPSFTTWKSTFLWSDPECKNYFVTAPVEKFILSQENITIHIGDFANYGMQAAPINALNRIRKMGFTGEIRVVYQDWHDGGNKEKVFRLLNLPSVNTSNNYHDAVTNTTIILASEYDNLLANKKITPSVFTIDGSPGNMGQISAIFSSFHYNQEDEDSNISFLECGTNKQNYIRQNNTGGKTLIVPISTFADAEKYLETDQAGIALAKQLPALTIFLDVIKNKTANVMPIYGHTIREDYLNNLIGFILGSRYAQLYGNANLQKPLIIASFNSLSQDDLSEIQSLITHHATVFKQKGVAHAVPLSLQQAINELTIDNVFSVIRISDRDAQQKLATLKSNHIYLLALEPLPKVIFDGIFTSQNVLVPVHEGAGTYTSLITTGRPHLHCTSTHDTHDDYSYKDSWSINLDLANDKLRERLIILDNKICDKSFSDNWPIVPVHKLIGEYIIDANNRHSDLSIYFSRLKENAFLPENDRIRFGIFEAMQLLNTVGGSENTDKYCLSRLPKK